MPGLPVHIIDGYGSGNKLKVNGEGEIPVVIHTHPPIDEQVESFPFSQYFTDDGSSTGDNDMRVDGSTTTVPFYISAKEDKDVWIKTVSVRISDASAVLNKFGNLAALTNGVSWEYTNNNLGDMTIYDGIKTNLDFLRVGLASAGIGGTDAFKADLSGAGADTYLPVIDMTQTFGFHWGIRLSKGSKDKLIFRVNDDLSTGMDQFDILAFGVQL
jgi:hypothetical protein